eukprot:TRINITY_DN9292_c0_g1_i1.p1 TRINITY_DN9292_c0_g1~~TRINITY_DN9292_c0_g1_i1.p1  ORF type:complete len:239 (-),score=15.69 TRINITY_DN9292_c0_g1_i1:236-952(-)
MRQSLACARMMAAAASAKTGSEVAWSRVDVAVVDALAHGQHKQLHAVGGEYHHRTRALQRVHAEEAGCNKIFPSARALQLHCREHEKIACERCGDEHAKYQMDRRKKSAKCKKATAARAKASSDGSTPTVNLPAHPLTKLNMNRHSHSKILRSRTTRVRACQGLLSPRVIFSLLFSIPPGELRPPRREQTQSWREIIGEVAKHTRLHLHLLPVQYSALVANARALALVQVLVAGGLSY